MFSKKVFILLVLIIIGSYYAGFFQLIQPVGNVLVQLLDTLSGRTTTGQPSGFAK